MSKIINKFISKFSPKHLEKKIQKKFQQALSFHQAEQLAEAQSLYLKILKINPKHSNSLHFLGVISHQTGDSQLAVDLISEAIAINPNSAAFYSNLGVALMELKHFEPALASYDKAIALNSNNADFHYNRGNLLRELKQLNSALTSYDKAIELNSNSAEYYHNRGNILKDLKHLDSAVVSYEKAMQLNPDHEIYLNYGNVLLDLKQPEAAITNYNKAIQLHPDYAEAYANLGNVLVEINQTDEAIINYNKAIQLNPDYAEAYANLGGLLVELKQTELAITNYKKAIQLKPNYKFLLGTIFSTRSKICDWSEYDENYKKLEIKIQNKELSSLPFSVLSITDSLSLQRSVAELYSESEYPVINALEAINKRSRSKKIRIGYYSADFRNHPVSLLTAELYEAHDREKFEIYAFSFGKIKDEITARIEAGVDHFYDVSLISDKGVVKLSRNLKIDIAVDLGGHTQYARTGIFAMRAAPIQTSYIGYLGTMGASYFDYLIADKTIIPAESQKYYSEKIVYLPSYQVNDSKKFIPTDAVTRQEFGLPENGFVFCCFNNNYKITPHVFDIWARIIKKVENSVLFIYAENELVKNNLKKEIILRGLDANRLVFGKFLSLDKYLARYRAADLFLDTLPYNAGTTASDALRMGLPVLTLMGESFASRIAASLLNSLDLPELITTTKEEYENLAIELATNPEKLKTIKEKLQKNILTTPLFNTKIFTNHIEAAYEAMYDRYQNDLLPDHIEVL